MTRPALILFALTLAMPSSAHWWEHRVSDLQVEGRNKRCLQILSMLQARMTPESNFLVAVHTPESLAPLLRTARATEGEITAVGNILRRLRTDPPDHEALRNTLLRLRSPDFRNRLFLCVAGEGCEMQVEDAIYDPAILNFEVVRGFGRLRDTPVPRTDRIAGLRREMNVILVRLPMQYPEVHRPIIFVANLFHETQHFMDVDFMSRWVSANRILLRNGRPTDELFRRFIRVVQPGTREEILLVQQSFWTAFLESRNYGTTAAIYRQHLAPALFETINRDLRRNAMLEIEEHAGSMLLRAEGLDADSFEQLGDRWAARMRETIERARDVRDGRRQRAG